jgi:hypothetical protein
MVILICALPNQPEEHFERTVDVVFCVTYRKNQTQLIADCLLMAFLV